MSEAEADEDILSVLLREFGHAPDEDGGEKWIVYEDHALLVFHPCRKIKVFRRGSGPNDYCEIDPTPWR